MGKRKAEPEGEDLVVHVDHCSSWNHQSWDFYVITGGVEIADAKRPKWVSSTARSAASPPPLQKRFSLGLFLRADPRADPELAGGITHLFRVGDISGSSRKNSRSLLDRGRSKGEVRLDFTSEDVWCGESRQDIVRVRLLRMIVTHQWQQSMFKIFPASQDLRSSIRLNKLGREKSGYTSTPVMDLFAGSASFCLILVNRLQFLHILRSTGV